MLHLVALLIALMQRPRELQGLRCRSDVACVSQVFGKEGLAGSAVT
jgi:hypothetical protein